MRKFHEKKNASKDDLLEFVSKASAKLRVHCREQVARRVTEIA